VLASLAWIDPEQGCEVRLFDANEERLDLFDRFARLCFEKSGNEHAVLSSSEPAEALDQADDVIFCMGEDCARRFLREEPSDEEETNEKEDALEWRRGDFNRPTPLSKLSPHVRRIVTGNSQGDLTREDAIREALAKLWPLIPERAQRLSLLRGVTLPEAHTHLNWPAPLLPETREGLPHQVLRWIFLDDPVHDFLNAHKGTPVVQWLNGDLP